LSVAVKASPAIPARRWRLHVVGTPPPARHPLPLGQTSRRLGSDHGDEGLRDGAAVQRRRGLFHRVAQGLRQRGRAQAVVRGVVIAGLHALAPGLQTPTI